MSRQGLPDNFRYPNSGITQADINKFKKVMYLPIKTKPQNRLYDEGWERIFNKKIKLFINFRRWSLRLFEQQAKRLLIRKGLIFCD